MIILRFYSVVFHYLDLMNEISQFFTLIYNFFKIRPKASRCKPNSDFHNNSVSSTKRARRWTIKAVTWEVYPVAYTAHKFSEDTEFSMESNFQPPKTNLKFLTKHNSTASDRPSLKPKNSLTKSQTMNSNVENWFVWKLDFVLVNDTWMIFLLRLYISKWKNKLNTL